MEELHEKQKSSMSLLLDGKNVILVVILSTCSGKSVIFQLFPKVVSAVHNDTVIEIHLPLILIAI